jgi:hypothetical protein
MMSDKPAIDREKTPLLSRLSMSAAEFRKPFEKMDFLDGMLIPRGVCTGLFTAPGLGKTTSQLTTAIAAATSRIFPLFGSREHDRPLRTLLVLGEDTRQTLRNSLANAPSFGPSEVQDAVDAGNAVFLPLLDTAAHIEAPEIFGEDGNLTDHGKDLFREIRQSGPWDFIVFDTLTSLSASEYLDRRSSYATTNALTKLASATNAAVLYNGHLTKGGGSGQLKSDCSAADVYGLAAGSGGLLGAARNMLVIVRRPQGVFENVEAGNGDEVLLGACKSAVNPRWNGKIFPVIRDTREGVLRAVDREGVPLLQADEHDELEVARYLHELLPLLIEACAEAPNFQALSSTGSVRPGVLATGSLSALFEYGTTAQVDKAMKRLVREGTVVEVRQSEKASPMFDVPGGPFASPDLHIDPETGKPPKFRKGAPDPDHLAARIEELRDRNAARKRGAPLPEDRPLPVPEPELAEEAPF